MPDPQSASAARRLHKVDFARGLALIGVMGYHLSWDLRYYAFVLWPIDTDWGWIAAQKALVSAFVGLSGLSLWLAHGDGIRWRPFWRRWLIRFGAAMLVTLATLVAYPEAFVYFGVLQALALFALIGLAFLRMRAGLLLSVGAAIVALGVGFQHPVFNQKILSWFGFWVVPPYTNDLVPIFPWFGVFLIGIGLGRVLTHPAPRPFLAGAAPWGRAGRGLTWIGRHSLILYLMHQPLLLAVLVPLDALLQPTTWYRAERFVDECQQSCTYGGADPNYCQRYCACSLEQIEAGNLWEAIVAPDPTPRQSRDMSAMTSLCIAMGRGDSN
jgi:uncharacterized membrane protein